jgi:RNA-directed DNA polymerase
MHTRRAPPRARCKTRQPSTPSRRSKKAPDKTLVTHIDEGLDFLGWHIQRHPKRGTSQHYVYVYPSKKAVLGVKRKIKTPRRTVEPNQPLDVLLRRLNATLRGWCGYFRAGVSSAVFAYLSHYVWQTVWRWLRRKHRKSTWKQLRRRYCGGGWWPASEERELIDLEKIGTSRYPLPRRGHPLTLAAHR